MDSFKAQRKALTGIMIAQAPADRVFPLLCPVRETDWLADWDYRMVFSNSGLAEAGCVFTTHQPDDPRGGEKEVWVVSRHRPDIFQIDFVRVMVGLRTIKLELEVYDLAPGKSRVVFRQIMTALTPAGNELIEGYFEDDFTAMMDHMEQSLNHYLTTGQRLGSPA